VDWYSNSARFRSATQDGVATWYAGFVGPNSEFIALTQGFDVNQTWLQIQLEANKPTEEVILGNSTWEIFESIKENNPQKSKDFLMVLEYDSNAVLVYGVAPRQQLEEFATQLSLLIEANNTN
jgi:protein involved in polysaccharide export with SLBB domain